MLSVQPHWVVAIATLHLIVSVPDNASGAPVRRETALHAAVINLNQAEAELFERLAAKFAASKEIDVKNHRGDTALHVAVQLSSLKFVEILLRHGASAGEANDFGALPVHLAAIVAPRNDHYSRSETAKRSLAIRALGLRPAPRCAPNLKPRDAPSDEEILATLELVTQASRTHVNSMYCGSTPLDLVNDLAPAKFRGPMSAKLSGAGGLTSTEARAAIANSWNFMRVETRLRQNELVAGFPPDLRFDPPVNYLADFADSAARSGGLRIDAVKGGPSCMSMLHVVLGRSLFVRHQVSTAVSGYENVDSKQLVDLLKGALEAGANPNARNHVVQGTPLHYAPSAAEVRVLLEFGADPNASEGHGRTPLHLLRQPAPLFSDSVDALVKAGADLNASDVCGNTPLHRSIDDIERAKILVEKGAAIGALVADGSGRNALHLARTQKGILYALDLGLDANSRDAFGRTPLHLVESVDAMSTLLEKKAALDASANANNGDTVLHSIARFAGRSRDPSDVIRTLMAKGARARVTNKLGECPADVARNWTVVKALGGAGARCKMDKQLPLHRAFEPAELDSILSKDRGALQRVDDLGRTALHAAALRGDFAAANLLICRGSDEKVLDDSKKTARDLVSFDDSLTADVFDGSKSRGTLIHVPGFQPRRCN